jgi:hypothetical protein
MENSLLLKRKKLGEKQGSSLFKQEYSKTNSQQSLFLKHIITVQSKPSKNQLLTNR